jgi:hypothetical protein
MSEETIPSANNEGGEKAAGVVDKPQESNENPAGGQNTPPEGSPRWNEMYGKQKRLERQFDDQTHLMTAIREENRKLQEDFSAVKQETIDRTAVTVIESLETKKVQALRDEDYETVTQIDGDIRKEENKKINAEWEARRTANAKTLPPPLPPQQIDPAVQRFVIENKWADPESPECDHKMLRYAKDLDRDLEREDPRMPTATRLQKVKEKTEADFTKKPAPTPTVEGGGEYYDAPAGEKASLSQEQKAVAIRSMPDLPPAEAIKEYIKYMK